MMSKATVGLIWILVFCASTFSQSTGKSSISGRITIKDKPAQGVIVTLEPPPGEVMADTRGDYITKTDASGYYRFDDVAKGQHLVAPRAYAYVLPVEVPSNKPGRNIKIAAEESVENINFDLVPGAVITGRITDYTGRPAIRERVQVWKAGVNARRIPFIGLNYQMYQTDDRGIYRLYGMPAGRYLISVGVDASLNSAIVGAVGSYSPIRYYSGTGEGKEPRAIELSEGQEVSEINIVMARPEKTFLVKGRIIDAASGAPVVNALFGFGTAQPDRPLRIGPLGYSGARTNENGEFQVNGLTKGNYGVFLKPDNLSDFYIDQALFEISDHDLEGIEVAAKKGATISGRVEFDDGGAGIRPTQPVAVAANSLSRAALSSPSNLTPVNPDGSFQITGLPPGRVSLQVNPPPGFRVLKYERDGVRFLRDLELAGGEKIGGIRVVLAQGTGSIKGQVGFEGGKLPEGFQFFVIGFRVGEPSDDLMASNGNIVVDSLGRFSVEGLLPGDYDVRLVPVGVLGNPETYGLKPQSKIVSVTSGLSSVKFTVDLSKMEKK